MRVAIIPARGGSRRISGKNIRLFHGKPIIAYSIAAAKDSGLFDHIVVTSDDPKMRRVAVQCGAVAIQREMTMSFDDVGTQDVTADALVELEATMGLRDLAEVCCIYATAPMMTAADLKRGYEHMQRADEYAYVHGWYYWGKADWFGDVPLTRGVELDRPEGRWIDINDESDWLRAESMYRQLKVAA